MISDIKRRRSVGRPKGPEMVKVTTEYTIPEKALFHHIKKRTKKSSYRNVIIDAVLHHYPDAPGILAREQELHERTKAKQSATERHAIAIKEEFS